MSETLNISPRGPQTSSVCSYKQGSPCNSPPRSQWERSAHPQHRDVTLHLTDSPSLVFSLSIWPPGFMSRCLKIHFLGLYPSGPTYQSGLKICTLSLRVTRELQRARYVFFYTHRWYIETHTHTPDPTLLPPS